MDSFCGCFFPRDHRPERKKLEKSDKSPGRITRLTPIFHRGENRDPNRGRPTASNEEIESRTSRQSSIVGHSSRRAARSGHRELEDIKDDLVKWLTAHEVSFDGLQATASSLLSGVFASHESLWKYNSKLEDKNNKLEDKVTRRDRKIRGFEIDRAAANQEITRLGEVIRNYDHQILLERAETAKLVNTHTAEIASLNLEKTKLEAAHDKFVGELMSTHEEQIVTLNGAHQTAVTQQQEQHEVAIQYERDRVRKVEQDMRLSVDYFQALQDDELKTRFYKLTSEIERLSRLPPAQDLAQRMQALGLDIHLPPNSPRGDHCLLLHGALWAVVEESLFRTPFQVFGAYGDAIHETWISLFGHGDTNGNGASSTGIDWPERDTLAEKWRYTTVDCLRRSLNSDPSGSASHAEATNLQDQQIQESFHANMATVTSRLTSLLLDYDSSSSSVLAASISGLLNQAATFALLIALERCRVQVFVPAIGGPSNTLTRRDTPDFKDVYPGNEAEMPCGVAEFVVAPGLSKAGNSRGGKLDERVVLSRATVYFTLMGGD